MKKVVFMLLPLLIFIFCYSFVKKKKEVESKQTLVILDSDPGLDDAFAYFLMAKIVGEPHYCIATYGNGSLAQTQKNANILREYLNMKSIIVKGCGAKLDGTEPQCDFFNGIDAFAGIADSLARIYKITPSTLQSNKQLTDVAKAIMQAEEVKYIVIGPLTTLATLIKEYPETQNKITNVYIMGGGIHAFNNKHETEYNFSEDPLAVQKVFESNLDITLVPLDFTYLQYIDKENILQLASIGTYQELIYFLNHNYKSNIEICKAKGAILHDIFPILYLFDKDKFYTTDMLFSSNVWGHIEENKNGRNVHVVTDMIEKDYHINLLKQAFQKEKY